MKKHLKKEDAIAELKARCSASIMNSREEVDRSNFPEEFKAFLSNMEKTIADVRMMKSQGLQVVSAGLRHVSDEDLTALEDIMVGHSLGRKGTDDAKVARAIQTMFPRLGMMENAKKSIAKVQESILHEFMSIYADEYNVYASGGASFDNKKFAEHVRAETVRRRTLLEAALPAQQQQQPPAAQCTLQ